jgi:hypothetical protein
MLFVEKPADDLADWDTAGILQPLTRLQDDIQQ